MATGTDISRVLESNGERSGSSPLPVSVLSDPLRGSLGRYFCRIPQRSKLPTSLPLCTRRSRISARPIRLFLFLQNLEPPQPEMSIWPWRSRIHLLLACLTALMALIDKVNKLMGAALRMLNPYSNRSKYSTSFSTRAASRCHWLSKRVPICSNLASEIVKLCDL